VEIQNLSEGIILAILSEEPNITCELATVVEALNADQACDVIVNFSAVGVITSSSIGKLIELRDVLQKRSRRLILSDVALPTRCIFKVVGLEQLFEFSDNKDTALAELENASRQHSLAARDNV